MIKCIGILLYVFCVDYVVSSHKELLGKLTEPRHEKTDNLPM